MNNGGKMKGAGTPGLRTVSDVTDFEINFDTKCLQQARTNAYTNYHKLE